MIKVLTKALIQTPETGGPVPRPKYEPLPAAQQGQVVQLMVMEEEMKKDNMQEEEEEAENKNIEEQEFHIKSLSTLRQVFCDDSDQESFHGFPDC